MILIHRLRQLRWKKEIMNTYTRTISMCHIYFSFTGGPDLKTLEEEYGSPMARPFYCSLDLILYYPEPAILKWDLGYLGTYSPDRQPPLKKLMLDAAENLEKGKFVVAGPQYPSDIIRAPKILNASNTCLLQVTATFTTASDLP